MFVSCLGYCVRLEEIGSRSEVRELAKRTGAVLIGDDYQAYNYVRIRDESGRTSLDVVLCLSIQGVKPHVLLRAHPPHMVVGFDSAVVGFDLRSGSKVYETELSSPFHEFIQLPDESGTLVLTELGALMVSDDGKCQWDYMDDLIEDYDLHGETLRLKFEGSRVVSLNVRNGTRRV